MKSETSIVLRPEYEWAHLSPAQRRLWILHQFDGRDASWNRPLVVQLTGKLDVSALERSLKEIVGRHGILRSVFTEIDGEPMQRARPLADIDWEVRDLGVLPERERLDEARRIAAQEAHSVFDLERGPLLRARLLGLSRQAHVLLILMHHIVFDGWSESILLDELATLYEAYSRGETRSPLPKVPMQYVDFAAWQNRRLAEGALETQLNYWGRQLHGLSPLSLMTDYPRTVNLDNRGAKHRIVLPLSLTKQLKELSRRRQATLFMTLFTVFHSLLSRYTGQHDFAIGVPIAGRTEVETERLIGCFMNVLVLRTDTPVDDSFEQALNRVRAVALEAYENQEVPFEKLVEKLRPERMPNHWPLFQAMFNLRNMPRSELRRAGDLTIEPFSFDSRLIGGLDLSLEVVDKPNGLHCSFNYPCSLFAGETICRMAQHFHRLLEGIVADSGRRMFTLPLLSEPERRQLVVEWNSTGKEYPINQCLHGLFETQIERTPNSVAVICGNRQLSYRELDERSNQVAHYLRERGVKPDVSVAICLHRCTELVVLILGILKAGGAYVPLDPEYPEARLQLMIRDAQIPILITSAELAGSKNLSSMDAAIDLLIVDQNWEAIGRENAARLVNTIVPENLAYVIYTSGSLGAPKAVMVPHRGVCNYLMWRCDYFPLTGADRVLQTSSFSFDDSVWELFEPLSVGATVIIPEAHECQDVSQLVALLAKHQVTAACFVPSLLEAVIEDAAFASCRDLRRVTTGGESLLTPIRSRFVERCSGRLYNGYGPTEATIAATFYSGEGDVTEATIPIGRPIANAQVYILDSYLNPVPVGLPGEIYIGGAGVCRGYLNNPDGTAENLVPDPFGEKLGSRLYKTGDWGRYLPDGNIQFVGRRDHQVKIRGYRIELAEIERALRCHPDVRQAVVSVLEPRAGDKRLAAYYVVSAQSPELTANNLRSFLTARLPSYMVPSAFVRLESLPRTRSGKVDRQALPATENFEYESSSGHVAPRNSLEATLVALWSDLLGLSQIGIHDNFFERGGHSLLATRLISRLRESFRIDLQLRALFEHPTIEAFAQFLLSQIPSAEVSNALVDVEALSETEAQSFLLSDPIQLKG
jgi:amino acid adenylation domain-containing protein